MALVISGGHAQYASVDWRFLIPVPNLGLGFSMLEAGGTCETWMTAYMLLYMIAGVRNKETPAFNAKSVLVHAGGSGVGLGKCVGLLGKKERRNM